MKDLAGDEVGFLGGDYDGLTADPAASAGCDSGAARGLMELADGSADFLIAELDAANHQVAASLPSDFVSMERLTQ
jgi:hypothetical protein